MGQVAQPKVTHLKKAFIYDIMIKNKRVVDVLKKMTGKEIFLLAVKHIVGGAAGIVVFYFLSKYFGNICPTYRIFKIPCPFCGMTRAHLSAFRLDFATAFRYNPTFFLGIPCIFFMTHDCFFTPKNDKYRKIAVGILLGIIVAAYLVRVFLYGFDFL